MYFIFWRPALPHEGRLTSLAHGTSTALRYMMILYFLTEPTHIVMGFLFILLKPICINILGLKITRNSIKKRYFMFHGISRVR